MNLKNYELAEQDYMDGMKYKDIATKYGVTLSTVKSWKTRYKWDRKSTRTKNKKVCIQKAEEKQKKQAAAETVEQVLKNEDLNDQQRLFCLYYSRSFNATRAYMKAYPDCTYASAMARSSKLMKDNAIREEIFRLKQAKMNKAMLEPEDIFQKYMEIAFSDITDYVSFGREEVQVMSAFGPVETTNPETGEKVPLKKTVNTVRFRESDMVDGSLVSEVSQGKDGAKIKLADRMKALSWLADHMDMATPEQAARVEKLKAEAARIHGSDQNPTEDKVEKLLEAIGGALDELE
ncbi:terminase small subunit [Zhenpiania hominis]|uniref:terminase small subunit n=1 Tax=Zhenpiania hominis TaxID=2763644 RepID=UPI0039F4E5D2